MAAHEGLAITGLGEVCFLLLLGGTLFLAVCVAALHAAGVTVDFAADHQGVVDGDDFHGNGLVIDGFDRAFFLDGRCPKG